MIVKFESPFIIPQGGNHAKMNFSLFAWKHLMIFRAKSHSSRTTVTFRWHTSIACFHGSFISSGNIVSNCFMVCSKSTLFRFICLFILNKNKFNYDKTFRIARNESLTTPNNSNTHWKWDKYSLSILIKCYLIQTISKLWYWFTYMNVALLKKSPTKQ